MTGETYTNTFGGENVSPANLSYVAYTISEPIALTWAFEAAPGDNVTADKIDINCSVANLTVKMPPANQVTVGQDALFGGTGAEPFVVIDHGGNVICTVGSGLEWFIWLIDNSTENGIWRSVQFGASTSVANAAALAGAGLRARVARLDQNLITTPLTSSYTVIDGDRATVLENTGGSVTYTFPSAGVVGNGWFVYIINAGTGNIALTPVGGQTIDGSSAKSIEPGGTLAVLSDGVNYHSLGYGRSVVNTVTGTAIAVGGPAGTVTLSATQASAQIQDYTGVLTGNRRVEYGPIIGYWFVYNNTTPTTPYTMTMAVGAGDPGVIVPQSAFSILRSNGTNMAVAFSGAVGTVTSVATSANMIGGPITSTGTLDLSSTGVTAGTYGAAGPPITVPAITVDLKGRITSASSITLGSGASINTGTGAGQIPILDSGGNLPSLNGGMQPGDIQYSIALTKPGFVFANGTTIGSSTSGASQRANADTVNLFAVIWALGAAQFPIFDNLGAASTRGANAAADFSANKRITLPDLRGNVIAGLDNAGGVTSANRINTYVSSTTMGAQGGAQAEAANLNIPQLFLRIGYWASPAQPSTAAGAVSVTISGTTSTESSDLDGIQLGGSNSAAQTHTHTFSGTGTSGIGWSVPSFGAYGLSDRVDNTAPPGLNGTTAAINVQPTMVMNPFVKL